eukprot:2678304-Pleurochrysis_carterae.AAC.3
MYRFASSAVRGGKSELETGAADATGAAVIEAADVAADCAWERTGFRGEGKSNEFATNKREGQCRA